VVARIRGGRLSQLGEVKFRSWWVVPLTALVQSALIRLPHPDSRLAPWHLRPLAMIGLYIVLGSVIWLNRQLPGMRVVLVGIALNLLVIAANGGYMPVPPEALIRIGVIEAAHPMPSGSIVFGSKDVVLPSQQALFWILGDILVIPEPFPWPTAMSIGDVLLAVGIFLFIVHTARSRSESE
jgi:hypothetical protein